jgi:hypothetical protein
MKNRCGLRGIGKTPDFLSKLIDIWSNSQFTEKV